MLELRKRFTSPETGSWIEIVEREGPTMKFEPARQRPLLRRITPIPIQKAALPVAAAIGRLRGYRPSYD